MTLPSRLMRAGMLGWRPRATWSSAIPRTGWPKIETLLSRTSAIIWQAGGALAAPPYPPRQAGRRVPLPTLPAKRGGELGGPPRQAGRRVRWAPNLPSPSGGGVGVGPGTDSRPAKREASSPPYPPRQAGRRELGGLPAKRGGELGGLPTRPPLQGEGLGWGRAQTLALPSAEASSPPYPPRQAGRRVRWAPR